MITYLLTLKIPIRVKANSKLEAFQRFNTIIDESFFYISEIPQGHLDQEAAFDEKVKPLLEDPIT